MSASSKRTIHIQLNPRLGMPVYRQIVGRIQRQAEAGRLAPGTQLPTVRALARQLRVNFNTVARAYRLLAQRGTLSTQPGRGTFVLDVSSSRPRARVVLHELAAEYVASARHMQFSDTQIAGALKRELGHPPASSAAGDNHE